MAGLLFEYALPGLRRRVQSRHDKHPPLAKKYATAHKLLARMDKLYRDPGFADYIQYCLAGEEDLRALHYPHQPPFHPIIQPLLNHDGKPLGPLLDKQDLLPLNQQITASIGDISFEDDLLPQYRQSQ